MHRDPCSPPSRKRSRAHTYFRRWYHLVFGTHQRVNRISPALKGELYPYMGGILRGLGGRTCSINGTADHFPILASVSPRLAAAEAVLKVKANSPGGCGSKGERADSLAGIRLQRVYPGSGRCGGRDGVHEPVRGASSDHDVRGRVAGVAAGARAGVGREVRLGWREGGV
ncbi:MAG: hypothetical protein FJX77_10150 [Armatimonadetes bacterium]|nr:hypothetical protein [Armatimonadota bacterium]